MNKLILNIQGKEETIDVPANLKEITPEMYLKILPFLNEITPLNDYDRLVQILAILLKLDKNFRLKYEILKLDKDEEKRLQLYKLTFFLFEPSTHNVFQTLQIKGKKYYSVADQLENMSVNEFLFANRYFENYRISQDANYLDLFMACIFRRKDPKKNEKSHHFDGDLRVKFNENILEKQAVLFKNVSIHIKNAVLLFFVNCLQNFSSNIFPDVFAKGDEKSKTTWFDVVNYLSKQPKDFKENASLSLPELLMFLNKEALLDKKNTPVLT